VDAVIDKDLASARLAEEIGVDIFMIATDVRGALINFDRPDERCIEDLSPRQARRYLAEGQFPAGSMGPKIEAAVTFVEKQKKPAVICSIEEIDTALKGRAGTQIRPAATKAVHNRPRI
jgi:carbamate kinase